MFYNRPKYVNILSTSILFSALFPGRLQVLRSGKSGPVLAPFIVLQSDAGLLFHVVTRGTFPRIRLDQLVDLAWKFLVPSGLGHLVLAAAGGSSCQPILGQAGLLLLGNLITVAVTFLSLGLVERRQKPAESCCLRRSPSGD